MSEPAAHETTPLEERLIALIRANGPISVADFMVDALGHPHDGYYNSRETIGAAGDFITAPEISQMFGEIVGLWLVQSWTDMGEPASFNLVELGPGRGVLMADILRAAALRPDFLAAANIILVEKSGRLRHEQRRRLERLAPDARWADDFAATPQGPCLIVANEFFDCLPIRQFERTALGWRERLVGVSADGARLEFVRAAAPPPPSVMAMLPDAESAPAGAIVETNEAGEALARELALRLVADGGRALIIDYGRLESGFGETLQAVRRHAYWPVLAAPGRADITAHVDFEALARAAIEAGASVWGPIAQGAFLGRLGIAARAERLAAAKTPEAALDIARALRRLAAPEEMGEVFKAMVIAAPGLPPPAGFER
jgi:NADH dehydrogenase [ubiquinone] 1 alpha subcomplex assembly factor 7